MSITARTFVNPLDALIAEAKQKAAEKAELLMQQKATNEARRHAAAQQYRQELEAEHFEELLASFSQCFLGKVGKYVFKPTWMPSYLELIKAYSLTLLGDVDDKLPKIDDRHVEKILDQFERALAAFPDIPKRHFFGQRLLTERQLAEATIEKPARIRYSDPAPKTHNEKPANQTAKVVEIRPATTPKGSKGGRPSPATMPKRRVG